MQNGWISSERIQDCGPAGVPTTARGATFACQQPSWLARRRLRWHLSGHTGCATACRARSGSTPRWRSWRLYTTALALREAGATMHSRSSWRTLSGAGCLIPASPQLTSAAEVTPQSRELRESGPAGRRGDSAGQHLPGDHRHAGVHVYPAVQQRLGELHQGQLLADLAQQRIRCERIHRQAGRHSACFTVGHAGNLVDRSQQRKVHHDAADLPDVLGALGPVLLHLGCLP